MWDWASGFSGEILDFGFELAMLVFKTRHFARKPGIAELAKDAVEAGIVRHVLWTDLGRELGEERATPLIETKSVLFLLGTALGGGALLRRLLIVRCGDRVKLERGRCGREDIH